MFTINNMKIQTTEFQVHTSIYWPKDILDKNKKMIKIRFNDNKSFWLYEKDTVLVEKLTGKDFDTLYQMLLTEKLNKLSNYSFEQLYKYFRNHEGNHELQTPKKVVTKKTSKNKAPKKVVVNPQNEKLNEQIETKRLVKNPKNLKFTLMPTIKILRLRRMIIELDYDPISRGTLRTNSLTVYIKNKPVDNFDFHRQDQFKKLTNKDWVKAVEKLKGINYE